VELHISRDEILRQVRGSLGIQTSSDLGSQVAEQHIIAINQAALKVQQECGWVNAQGRVTVPLQAEQDTLNYPEACGPGAIRAVSVYEIESERSFPLAPRVIPVHADVDQQQAAGGAVFQGVQGRPQFYEQREQVKLWPFSDKPYKIRFDYVRPVQMPTPNSVSIVDGQLIVYMATSLIATQMNDERMAAYYASLYVDRRNALMAWQSQGTSFAMSTDADLGEDEGFDASSPPNWDRGVTMPAYNSGAA
jgi:hypothetical protein